MNKISQKRVGVDGIERTLDDIRDYLVGEVEDDISTALGDKIANLAPGDATVM